MSQRPWYRRAPSTARLAASGFALVLVCGACATAITVGSIADRSVGVRLYWGAYASGGPYGLIDAPWDMDSLARFERDTGKHVSLLEWGQSWYECSTTCGLRPFRADLMERVRRRGAIPVLSWDSEHEGSGSSDRAFRLRAIIAGRYDAFLWRWAYGARRWGHPFFLRFDWEMNTDGVPYSEQANGNRPGDFVRMWRHVHDIFVRAGATNVTWVWCPNVAYPGTVPLQQLYPGNAYVDWTCLDGYNWGTNPAKPQGWRTFDQTFASSYRLLTNVIAPGKPMMIGETSSSEWGGSKARWISHALSTIPSRYPAIKALVWFNKDADHMDWVIESSDAARAAFATTIRSRPYATNRFAGISATPIPPPS